MINVINSKHSIKHEVLITIINWAKLYILIDCNYIKFLYILFKKAEFYLSTVMCEISKFHKKTYAILMFDNRLYSKILKTPDWKN